MPDNDTSARSASEADFTFRLPDLTTEGLKVTGFSGSEGISELYEFHIDFCSDVDSIDPTATVGLACFLEIAGSSGTRHVHGIVRRFQRIGQDASVTYYSADIVPAHWQLTKRYKNRIFQECNCSDMSVPGIIKKVLEDAGIPEDLFRFALTGEYEVYEYVVQYRESEMDFISRLMEEEGIYYFFEHTDEGYKIVFADSDVAHVASPLDAQCLYREPTGMVPEGEHVFTVRDGAELQVGATRLTDYDFTRPPLDLHTSATAERETALEISDYPGEYTDKDVGTRLVRIRLEEQQCRRHVLNMRGTNRGLLPGFTFELDEHPRAPLNREYLVTRLVHQASQSQSAQEQASEAEGLQYEATVRVIPSDIPFRAPRTTPRPTVKGSQTALVVGPSGEEIYTDQYGRVKVQFHWDLEGAYDENSSRWIRVSQGSAGGQYGIIFLPRVGQEVIVDFLEGDPDRPIITGRVYNADQMPPYTLPDEKTKSVIKTHSSKGGGGTNEIRFEDLKDSEQVFHYAQKDLHIRVNNDRVENVDNDRHLTVKSNKNESVGGDRSLAVGGNLKEKIAVDVSTKVEGKESKHVMGTLTLTCDSDVVEKFGASHKHEVSMTYACKALAIKLEASTGIELKCGGSSIVLTPAAIFIAGGPLVNINTGAGPPVGPVMAMATTPEDPAAPIDADTATPGSDTTYNAEAQEYEALEVEVLPDEEVPEEPQEEVELTWIEIELVDEADQPCAGERFELKLPNDKIRKGTLDANGVARVDNIPPGECQICFPKLDADAWERI
ncbi:MAG: type VI secretion system tip protein TssI/VgrG [Planctomycetota bacterium]